MPRVLLVAATTGYQVQSFQIAARRIGVDLMLATDRCRVLDDPWNDQAIAIRFENEVASVQAITEVAAGGLDGVIAVGDRSAEIAASAAAALGLRLSRPNAVRAAGNKLLTRRRICEAGLACPVFVTAKVADPVHAIADRVGFPCVVKPLAMSASRGVQRANTLVELEAAVARTCHLLMQPDVVPDVDASGPTILVEQYIPGREVAVDGVMTSGNLQVLAIFEKPDPLEGPFFEETIYVTPPVISDAQHQDIYDAVSRTATALGLTDGPIHAECRSNDAGVFVLEVAARPIGGLCSRALRFRSVGGFDASLEEVLLRHALGESVTGYSREDDAAGVMMIPIPCEGRFREVSGVNKALAVSGIEEVVITGKRGQRFQQLPEGGSYLGFIFARSEVPGAVIVALLEAHAQLQFEIVPFVPVSRFEHMDAG